MDDLLRLLGVFPNLAIDKLEVIDIMKIYKHEKAIMDLINLYRQELGAMEDVDSINDEYLRHYDESTLCVYVKTNLMVGLRPTSNEIINELKLSPDLKREINNVITDTWLTNFYWNWVENQICILEDEFPDGNFGLVGRSGGWLSIGVIEDWIPWLEDLDEFLDEVFGIASPNELIDYATNDVNDYIGAHGRNPEWTKGIYECFARIEEMYNNLDYTHELKYQIKDEIKWIK